MKIERIEQDYEGLRIAAEELLEAQHHATVEEAAPQFAGAAPARTLHRAYYERTIYLFELERAELPAHRLLVEQARGMAAIERARREFDEKHPSCPRCGPHCSPRRIPSAGAASEAGLRRASKCRQ